MTDDTQCLILVDGRLLELGETLAEALAKAVAFRNAEIAEKIIHGEGDNQPVGLLFGLPVYETDDLPDVGEIVFGPSLI